MSISEKDAVLRERAARVAGCVYAGGEGHAEECLRRAPQKYPLPKVTRPRIVVLNGYALRAVAGEIEWAAGVTAGEPRWVGVSSRSALSLRPTTFLVRALADLLANPTEEVEA